MKTKKILSKKEKEIKRMDLIVLLICFIITNIKLMLNQNTNLIAGTILTFNLFKNINVLISFFICAIYVIVTIISSSLWILLIYIAFRISRLNVIKENKKYEVIDNIEYYRDKFDELSPGEISLISDLEIEENKDISATLLKLYLKKLITFDNNKITVVSSNISGLKTSESYLLSLLSDGNLSLLDKKKWKSTCMQEALDDGYLENKETIKKKHFWGSTLLFIFSICMIIHSILFFSSAKFSIYNEKLQSIVNEQENLYISIFSEDYEEIDDSELTEYLQKNPDDFKTVIYFTLNNLKYISPLIIAVLEFILGGLLIFFIPIYKVFRKISYYSIEKSNKLKRTKTR